MILGILFFAFILYLLYKFIFHFALPLYRTTKKMKAGFREMSARMNQTDGHEGMYQHMHKAQQAQQQPVPNNTAKRGDYIDFEEVKE